MSNCPARAGFTGPRRPADAPRWDHPRSRGVYHRKSPGGTTGEGSSPLARGLRQPDPQQEQGSGIIPARAGFTLQSGRGRRIQGDHPRSRGVYGAHEQGCGAVGGSSPLARGLLAGALLRSVQRGIIPARAGFTTDGWGCNGRWGDHPRSRGVYPGRPQHRRDDRGSSPLARGLQERVRPHDPILGIIPARAGFTSAPTATGFPQRDHPRSRGVYVGSFLPARPPVGSSPLARGLLRD